MKRRSGVKDLVTCGLERNKQGMLVHLFSATEMHSIEGRLKKTILYFARGAPHHVMCQFELQEERYPIPFEQNIKTNPPFFYQRWEHGSDGNLRALSDD